jgi:hypothetical protein
MLRPCAPPVLAATDLGERLMPVRAKIACVASYHTPKRDIPLLNALQNLQIVCKLCPDQAGIAPCGALARRSMPQGTIVLA